MANEKCLLRSFSFALQAFEKLAKRQISSQTHVHFPFIHIINIIVSLTEQKQKMSCYRYKNNT